MNAISTLNQYCQQNNLQFPEFNFYGTSEAWYCSTTWNQTCWQSKSWSTKKAAKEEVANMIVTNLSMTENESFILPSSCIFLIDGDQRMDCWKWLTKCTWNNTTHVMVFVSPTCPEVETTKNINVIKSKTTNRDSSDALMLISLGKLLSSEYFKAHQIVIVSSDHILVQAAQDEGLHYAPNLKGLIELLENFH